MKLYHGSNKEIIHPSLTFSREDIDFGAGFYLTNDELMAKKWSSAKYTSVVNIYEVDTDSLKTKHFKLDEEWLSFVKNNRLMLPLTDHQKEINSYDLLIGATADDRLYDTIQSYLNGTITEEQAIRYLNSSYLSTQFVFKNQSTIESSISFIKSYEIFGHEKNDLRQIVRQERFENNRRLDRMIRKDLRRHRDRDEIDL